MVKTEIKAAQHKIFPEVMWATNGQNLVAGQGDLFKIDGIPPNEIAVPMKYAVESVASIKHEFRVDNTPISKELPSDALGGIDRDADLSPHPDHEMGFAFNNFRWIANNGSGGTSTDHRARLLYLVDARTTARRIIEKIATLNNFNTKPNEDPTPIAEEIRKQNKNILTKRDISAIQILWQERQINVLAQIINGSRVPPTFGDFLKIHEVVGTFQDAIKATLTASYSDTSILNYDVPDGRVATLEGLSMDVGAQATVGEKTISISRDDDKDFLTLDPACMGDTAKHYPFHIHGFNNINVRIKDDSATANYKAWAAVTIRQPGAAFKAKMEEFSPGVLPSSLEPTEAEERIIEALRLREIARTGIIAIS